MTSTTTLHLEELPGARRVEGMEPGSDGWRAAYTASKIGPILDVSPWATSFTLWLEMRGEYTPPPPTGAQLARGSHLEDGIARWWAEDHPGWEVYGEATYQSSKTTWAYATPDRVLRDEDGELALLEVKTSASTDTGWSAATGDIPPQYLAQIMWQVYVTGVRRVFVTCLGPFLKRMDFEFVFTDGELELLLGAVSDFRTSVAEGSMPPVVDVERDLPALLATTAVEREEADVTDVFDEYRRLKLEQRELEARVAKVRAEMCAEGADAECLVAGGRVVADRQGGKFRFKPVR